MSLADFPITKRWPANGMVRNFINYYEAGSLVEYDKLKNVPAWLARGLARPAVQRGLTIPAGPQA